MSKAIADSGPVLHLHEIGLAESLAIFDSLIVPDLVAEELRAYGLEPARLGVAGLNVSVIVVNRAEWETLVAENNCPTLHPADAQVFALARSNQFQTPVLTDDLALRKRLESCSATVVGSVGVLVRAFSSGRLKRSELDSAIDELFTHSTLYASPAFIAYVHRLLADLAPK